MKLFILVASMSVASMAFACNKGCQEHQGVCVCDAAPVEEAPRVTAGVVSDEKPPRHPQPAYERGDVIADMPPNLIAQDAKVDREIKAAVFEGKKAAGLN